VSDLPRDSPIEGEPTALERRELERRAYGPTSTADEELEALAARRWLRQIGASSPGVASDRDPGAVEPQAAAPTLAGSEVGKVAEFGELREVNDPPRRGDPRRTLPIVVVALVALIVGTLVGRTIPVSPPAASHASSTPGADGSSMLFTMPPRDQTASTLGQTWFSRKQQSSDRFLFYDAPHSVYQPSTVRLVATSTVLGSVYIAKRAGSGSGVCLIVYGPKSPDGSQAGTTGCASANALLTHGIVVKIDEFEGLDAVVARWTGPVISVSSHG
jgi:hypothetical protein